MTNKEFFNKLRDIESGKLPTDKSIINDCSSILDNNSDIDSFYSYMFFNKKFTWQWNDKPKIWIDVWNKLVELSKKELIAP